MQSGTGEPQMKDCQRIAGVLQKSDLHSLVSRATHADAKDMGVSWVKEGCQFHLMARPRSGMINWQLFFSKGVNTAMILQTSENNVNALYSQLLAKTNEICKAESRLSGPKVRRASLTGDIELSSAFQAQSTDEEWVSCLIANKPVVSEQDEKRLPLITRAFSQDALTYISALMQVFNQQINEDGPVMTMTDLGDVEEHISELEPKRTYHRWRLSNSHWCLSARSRGSLFEMFLIHASDAVRLYAAESDPCKLMQLQCTLNNGVVTWWNGRLPITAVEMRLLVKNAFSLLVKRTMEELEEKKTGRRAATNLLASQDAEKQLLAQKIIIQQEQLQKQIARDLHDAVIADINVLKRGLSGESGPPIANEQIIRSLDEIETRLREICYDLSPTDLRDWGLKTTLEALVDQVSQRTNAKCQLQCDLELPPMDGAVELHIFRILQESLSNVVKYAKAGEITVSIERSGDELIFAVKDDGKGMDFTSAMKQARQGGMGMSGMQERVGIIRSYYPATLTVTSKPGRGTATRLSLQVPQPEPAVVAGRKRSEPNKTQPLPEAEQGDQERRPSALELLASED